MGSFFVCSCLVSLGSVIISRAQITVLCEIIKYLVSVLLMKLISIHWFLLASIQRYKNLICFVIILFETRSLYAGQAGLEIGSAGWS